jgi:ketosteroid isomerase-like protein
MIARPLFLSALLAAAAPAQAAPDPALSAMLQAKTQAMADAVATGDKAVWLAATDPALLFVSENNDVMTRDALLKDFAPLPPGLVGSIKVVDYQLQRHGDNAVATYIADESLDYHGQLIKTQFRTTDAWHQAAGKWRMVSSMTLAVLHDPPAVALPAALLADYAGHYDLTSAIHYTIRVDGTRLLGARDGGGKEVELKAEAADLFFVPGSPRSRKVFLRDAAGHVTSFADRREGNDIVWRRI